MIAPFVYEPGVVEMPAMEVSPVVSFKERTVVFEIEPIPVVPVPGRIVIVGVSGEIGFTDSRRGIVTIRVNRCGCRRIGGTVNNGRGSDYDAGGRYPEAEVCAYKDLSITFCSDEAGGYNGGENK